MPIVINSIVLQICLAKSFLVINVNKKHGYDFQITEEAADMFGGNNGTSDQKRQMLLLEAHILLGYHLNNFL